MERKPLQRTNRIARFLNLPKSTGRQYDQAYFEGHAAYEEGLREDACPYPSRRERAADKHNQRRTAWFRGYLQARSEFLHPDVFSLHSDLSNPKMPIEDIVSKYRGILCIGTSEKTTEESLRSDLN